MPGRGEGKGAPGGDPRASGARPRRTEKARAGRPFAPLVLPLLFGGDGGTMRQSERLGGLARRATGEPRRRGHGPFVPPECG